MFQIVIMTTDASKIRGVLEKYKPVQAFLYGSRARGTSKPTSDYDIMIFFKKTQGQLDETQRFYKIAAELKVALEKPVDLVVMKCCNKWVNGHSEQDEIFFECVKYDAKCIFTEVVHGIELMDKSVKVGLFKG
jgi:predicted nucleotidyltransferase